MAWAALPLSLLYRAGTFRTHRGGAGPQADALSAKLEHGQCAQTSQAWENWFMAEAPASGESSPSKSLMWMMIAFFAGLAVLLGGGMFLASRISKVAGISASMSKDTRRTPGGSFRLEKESAIGPGLPVYPHASLIVPGETQAVEALQNAKKGIEEVTYHTTDTRDLVDDWYVKHLSNEFQRHDAGERPLPEVFQNARVSDSDIAFVAQRGPQVRVVALSLDASGTKIALIRLDKAAEQQ